MEDIGTPRNIQKSPIDCPTRTAVGRQHLPLEWSVIDTGPKDENSTIHLPP
jgi:hypothetical protein